MPYVHTPAMNLFLNSFGQTRPADVHAVLFLDQAGWHCSRKRNVPPKVTLLYLPPKSPELNPSELPWRECRQKYLSNQEFKTEADVWTAVEAAWLKLTANPATLRSLCGFAWLLGSIKN